MLPSTVTIPIGAGEVFVPLNPVNDNLREWTESVDLSVEDGDYYTLGYPWSAYAHIKDDDPALWRDFPAKRDRGARSLI